jgi:hypothetical protein
MKHEISVSGKKITVEIADSLPKKLLGLMFRKSLGENDGMLFIFGKTSRHSLWMANVCFPIEAVFIDEQLKIVEIMHLEPCKSIFCPTYRPKSAAKYILELNEGFTSKNSIKTGAKVDLGKIL